MTRRSRYLTAPDLEYIASLVADLRAATVIVDVEPLVVPWSSVSSAAFVNGATELCTLISAKSSVVSSIVFASNSRKARAPLPQCIRPETTVVQGAGKPWRTSYVCGLTRPVVVLGDQLLTDGLLAWRIGADFIHVIFDFSAPWWPRIQHAAGRPMANFLFLTAESEGGDDDLH
jgi:predicted HAD superfamily phosphohydrolase YqeG